MLPPDIAEFFQSYRAAFDALDGAAVAALYAEPAGIAQGGVYTHWPTREAVRHNMEALCEQYRERGYAGAQFEPVYCLPQGAQHACVDLRWTIQWAPGTEPWVFHTAYNLLRTAAGWRVLLCTAYMEDALSRPQQ